MDETATSTTDIDIDLSEPWDVPTRLLDALASFDQIVAQIDGAILGGSAPQIEDDLPRAA